MKKIEKALVPGFGISGQVMCPFSLMAPKQCIKQGCEMWIELSYGKQKVARCSFAWGAILSTELRESIDKLRLILENQKKGK